MRVVASTDDPGFVRRFVHEAGLVGAEDGLKIHVAYLVDGDEQREADSDMPDAGPGGGTSAREGDFGPGGVQAVGVLEGNHPIRPAFQESGPRATETARLLGAGTRTFVWPDPDRESTPDAQ